MLVNSLFDHTVSVFLGWGWLLSCFSPCFLLLLFLKMKIFFFTSLSRVAVLKFINPEFDNFFSKKCVCVSSGSTRSIALTVIFLYISLFSSRLVVLSQAFMDIIHRGEFMMSLTQEINVAGNVIPLNLANGTIKCMRILCLFHQLLYP